MHLCLLVDKKQITLAKDILESLQEDGLLFFYGLFFVAILICILENN